VKSAAKLLVAALVAAAPAAAHAGATITIVNADGPGEGFNDATPIAPVGGNAGTTVGEQRLNLFRFAANRWGAILDSSIEIKIQANFDPLTCTATSAVLGSAGAFSVFSDFPNAPIADTWFSSALANKIAGEDLDPESPDISARFNSLLAGDPACLNGATWYYGYDNNEGANQTDLLPVLMHEFAHGLGFQSFVNKTTGVMFQNKPDQYLVWMYDNSVSKQWKHMTDAERATSGKNGRRVVWNGPQLLAAAPTYLTGGTATLLASAPAAVAGRYLVGEATFGPALSATPLTGDLLYANDSSGNGDGCEAYAAGAFTGKIAVVDRGTCNFAIKAKNAQDAGAIAVVVADNAPGTPPAGLSGDDATITIPTVRVTQAAGQQFKAALGTGAVTISLFRDPTVLAGADESNRVMLYTPDPVATGSSVSHFDTSTSPNTLMEPSINSDLSDSVDLTLPLFRDLGWYADADVDLVPDNRDLCVHVADPQQLDNDGDFIGDACDADDDNDGVADATDNCRLVSNTGQENNDGDADGDACDLDDDNDGVLDAADNCPGTANPNQDDGDGNGVGDACENDSDGDGVENAADNCPAAANPNQLDSDEDGEGDACDADDDNDGLADADDNCSLVANEEQLDTDEDGQGDACDTDDDNDGVADETDGCPLVADPSQTDSDRDGQGDACDFDDDNDSVSDRLDNCPLIANASQADGDEDGIGDECDPDGGGDDGGGGCSVGSSGPSAPSGGALALTLLVGVALLRRRRS
jgi:MYXO-CTERM domain-containing protein